MQDHDDAAGSEERGYDATKRLERTFIRIQNGGLIEHLVCVKNRSKEPIKYIKMVQ